MASTQVIPEASHRPSAATPVADPAAIVIFGATGDLTSRKLVPALFRLWQGGFLPPGFAIVGVGRRDKSDDQFKQELRPTHEGPSQAGGDGRADWDHFAAHLSYHRADFTDPKSYGPLGDHLRSLEARHGLPGNRLFYLATDPHYFSPIVEHLAQAGLTREGSGGPWARVVLEKPFGHDLTSARALDAELRRWLGEDQLYRIDHYLGKETVQNVLAFRFGNAIFEPLFNRRYVDHVQITAAETVGMEGHRGAYYDHAGALRDVVQNHLLQLLALVAMEPPAQMIAKDLRDEKVKVLRSLVPIAGAEVERRVVRGQYGAGQIDGRPVPAYRQESGVDPASNTETYVALRLEVDNWRWAGVPFVVRTGKRLARRITEIAVQFKLPPLRLFTTVECVGDVCDLSEARPNVLVFRIQPDEAISLSFAAKRPGMALQINPVRMEFDYGRSFAQALPEAYERLLLDALRGDATLFMRTDELDAAWAFVTPILEAGQHQPPPAIPNYPAGSWGPAEADRLCHGCQQTWRQS